MTNTASRFLVDFFRFGCAALLVLIALPAAMLAYNAGDFLYSQKDSLGDYENYTEKLYIIAGFYFDPHEALLGGALLCIVCLMTSSLLMFSRRRSF